MVRSQSGRVCERERSSHHQIWTKQIIQCFFCRRSLSLHSPSFPSIRCSIRPPIFFLGCHVKINSSNMPKRSVSITFFLFSKIHLTLLNTHKCHCTFFDEFHRLILWSGMCTTHVQFQWKTNHGIAPTMQSSQQWNRMHRWFLWTRSYFFCCICTLIAQVKAPIVGECKNGTISLNFSWKISI